VLFHAVVLSSCQKDKTVQQKWTQMSLPRSCSDSRILQVAASLAAASAASLLNGPVWPGTQKNLTDFPTLGISETCHRISTQNRWVCLQLWRLRRALRETVQRWCCRGWQICTNTRYMAQNSAAAAKIVETTEKFLTLVDEGIAGWNMKYGSVNVNHCIVLVVKQEFDQEPMTYKSWRVASCMSEEPKVTGWSHNLPRWKRWVSKENDMQQVCTEALKEVLEAHAKGRGATAYLLLYARWKTTPYDGWWIWVANLLHANVGEETSLRRETVLQILCINSQSGW
jgi:hypothetical protein